MIKRKLIHPRKVVWVMQDFVNEVSPLTYNNEPRVCEMIKFRGFCAFDVEFPYGKKFVIGYNVKELWGTGIAQFSNNFFSRYPAARGFATVTLVLLHELGHFASQQKIENYDRQKELDKIHKLPIMEQNPAYFKLPDEKNATDWAIEWLSYPENRKIAKAFEKKFFACFEKR